MRELKTSSLRPKTQTVSVYTRHSADCPKRDDPHWKRCACFKYLYLLKDGKNKTLSAKTRSWTQAEQQAQDIRDRWDPVKQKLLELEERKQAQEVGEVTIAYALERWLTSVEADSDSGNEHTHSKYQTAAKQIGAWARANNLIRLSQITPDVIDQWKSAWSPKAKQPDNRIGKTTAGRRLEKVKGFLKYCVKMGWITKNPAEYIKAIKPDESVTFPLLSGRYEKVLAATYEYDKQARRSADMFGEELRAIIKLMRWSGLRLGDALLCARKRIVGNRYSLRTKKKGVALTPILPDEVVTALQTLPTRPGIHPDYFFWSGQSKYKSLTSQWERKLNRLNEYLSMVDDEGKSLRFHSHQLRDTFAVNHLLNGTSMADLSKLLGHKSIRTTEKYYSPWCDERQQALDQKATAALRKMGASVSL
jgi:site-specific recombinase XerD